MPRDDQSRLGGLQSTLDDVFAVVRSVAELQPAYASETDGSLFCFFCDKHIAGAPDEQLLAHNHELTCPWVQAQRLARK